MRWDSHWRGRQQDDSDDEGNADEAAIDWEVETMKTSAIIEGLTILEKYRDKPDGFNCGAEHDALYAYATDTPVGESDMARLIKLGWFQEGADYGDEDDDEFAAKHYDPEESWTCYT